MPGTGFFDSTTNTYRTKGTETWATYASWNAFTTWAGTANSSLTFTTQVQDTSTADFYNVITKVEASLPVTTVIRTGTAVDSAGAIVSPTTSTVTPSTNPVSAIYGRYFELDINLSQSSAADVEPIISSVDVQFNNRVESITRADIVTSTLPGSVGERDLVFDVNVGKIKTVITQAHKQNLGDSAQDSEVPIVLVDKTVSPVVLNIYDADSYGKRKRIDCRLDIQAQYLPLLASDDLGNIREI